MGERDTTTWAMGSKKWSQDSTPDTLICDVGVSNSVSSIVSNAHPAKIMKNAHS